MRKHDANGVKMPILGYGVYQVTQDECERCVLDTATSSFFSHYDPNMVEWFVKMGRKKAKPRQQQGKEELAGGLWRKWRQSAASPIPRRGL